MEPNEISNMMSASDRDASLRAEALGVASRVCLVGPVRQIPAAEVVAAARAFYDFLSEKPSAGLK